MRQRIALLILISGCSGSSSSTGPDSLDLSQSITVEGGSTVVFQDGGRLDAQRGTIERIIRETVAVARPLIPVDRMTILVLAGTSTVIPEIGFGGSADAGTVRLTFDPNSSALASSLDTELFPLLAHELHHVARSRTVGYGSDLLSAMISEGLADHFSIEVAGIDPPLWSSALSGEELETWTERSRAEWFSTSYGHDAWFFGTTPAIPRWAGYSIGFELVREFLDENASRRPSELHDAPAVFFVPST